jgi:membrane protease YdiL (CAAX protease family)
MSKWIWLALPVAIMLLFQATLPLGLQLVYDGLDKVDPRIFFYLPFISPLFPLALFLIAYPQLKKSGARPVVTTQDTLAADIGVGVAVGAGCVLLFVGSLAVLRSWSFAVPDFSVMSRVHHLFFSTIGAIVPGVAEELYFRGFLMREFAAFKPALAILVTSLAFASWHVLTPSYLPHTFLMGVLLGITYYRTKRLLPVMVAHTLANMSAGILILNDYI